MKDQPLVITRRQVGRIASIIGVIGLLVAAILFAWQGTLSGAALIALILGAAAIGLWALLTPDEFTGFITGRQMRHGTLALMSTLVLVAVVALTYIIVQRGALTLDMTQNTRFTLAPETQAVLGRVTRPMQITGFYSARSLQQREIDDQFFRLYEAETDGLIRRVYIDPDEQPALAQQYGVTQDAMVFLSYLTADGEVDFTSLARVPRSTGQERDMSEAVARLLIAGTLTVYFETGHGGRDPLDNSQVGLSGINNGVRESGLITQPLDLPALAAAGSRIPADASAVIFPRPLTDLSDAEIVLVDQYLDSGGAIFLMADPLFSQDPFLSQDGRFNQYLWDKYGIRALDAVVVDPTASGQTPLDIISAATLADVEITARLDPSVSPTLFSVARAVDVNLESAPEGIANGRVIMSSPESYGETDWTALAQTNQYAFDEVADLTGPLATVVWAWDQETDARILLVGDSDFVTNGSVMSGGNSILFTDGLAWLVNLQQRISFAPQAFAAGLPLVFLSQQTLDLIAFITVILMPGALLVAGLAIWFRRSRA